MLTKVFFFFLDKYFFSFVVKLFRSKNSSKGHKAKEQAFFFVQQIGYNKRLRK
jgi:hypothetical protein